MADIGRSGGQQPIIMDDSMTLSVDYSYEPAAARQVDNIPVLTPRCIKSAQLGEASITTEVTMLAAALRRAAFIEL